MRGNRRAFWIDDKGAVAPTVALSLFALVAAGGIAFDYARVNAMDTELQAAADQAALAAATQLDGQSGACDRARAAASSLLSNKALFANDSTDRTVTVTEGDVSQGTGCSNDTVNDNSSASYIAFYQSYDQTSDTPGALATTAANAKVVIVKVTSRQAVYALTPIVAAFRSNNDVAEAVAALRSAICKEPPVMICNPAETTSSSTFDASSYIGDGILLTDVGAGGGPWAPGNFGYLNTNINGINGAVNQLRAALSWNTPPGNCEPSSGVNTEPGDKNGPVTDAINTRFDIYQNPNTSCYGNGTCSASINVTKDVRRPANGNGCKWANNGNGWQFDTSGTGYYGQTVPTSAQDLSTNTTPSAMGSPRDECHSIASPSCSGGRVGDGKWDRDAYFRVNYVRSIATTNGAVGTSWTSTQWQTNTGLSPNVAKNANNYASRYNVYAWEIAHRSQTIDGVVVLGQRAVGATGSALVSYGLPQCSAPQGFGPGQVPSSTTPDRRRLSVAVVNCKANSVNGNSTNVPVLAWIDVFLVEPSLNRARTNAGDLYVEVIGQTQTGNGAPAGSVIKHDVPYLIK